LADPRPRPALTAELVTGDRRPLPAPTPPRPASRSTPQRVTSFAATLLVQ